MMTMTRSALVWAALAAAVAAGPKAVRAEETVANVVLVGATGNLAGKYLWQAMFNLYLENELAESGTTINFYGAGRPAADVGSPKIFEMIEASVHCINGTSVESVCSEAAKAQFVKQTQYIQLKKSEHYKAMCEGWDAAAATGGPRETGRMIYLSVPPFAYSGIAKDVKAYCTNANNSPWARVAFEKPFGSDLPSAKEMAADLGAALTEEQIYRVDHYLGKAGVKQISQFRAEMPEELKTKWNGQNIEEVQIIMKETENTKGRTGFYDAYGVFRDVHQNHLTEVLALVMMDEAKNVEEDTPEGELKRKATLLGELRAGNVRALQYNAYIDHIREDRADSTAESQTPTLGVAEMYVESPRWSGTRIVMLAGKGLDERRAYVQVRFRNGGKVVFHIQGGGVSASTRGPYVKVTEAVLGSQAWGVSKEERSAEESAIYASGDGADASYVKSAAVGPDRPYDRLIWAMFRGQQADFVGTNGLLASWQIWDTLLMKSMMHPLEFYDENFDINSINLMEPELWERPDPAGRDEL